MPGREPRPELDHPYIIKPVYKALELLRTIGDAGRPLRLTELSALTGLPKSTAFKYLRTLIHTEFVGYNPTNDTYRLGAEVKRLARVPDDHDTLRRAAQPTMRELQETFNETVNLGVLQGIGIVYLEIVQSTRPLRVLAVLGAHYPAYTTALGKAIMAFLPDDEWRSHLPSKLERLTSSTITTPQELAVELDMTRSRGYALDNGEGNEHVTCVAAPVFDPTGAVTAAISMSGPTTRMHPAVPDISSELMSATAHVSTRLAESA